MFNSLFDFIIQNSTHELIKYSIHIRPFKVNKALILHA